MKSFVTIFGAAISGGAISAGLASAGHHWLATICCIGFGIFAAGTALT